MDLSAVATLPFPRPVVFAAYRDELVALVDYLPNVRKIEVLSRVEHDGVVELHNVWHGGGDIPAAARAFLSEAMLSWDDYARWDARKWSCAWRIKTRSFTEAVRCDGENRFVETDDGGTRLEIHGTLTIDGAKVTGVPRFLAGKVAGTVESVLAEKIRPNLLETASSLRKHLEAKARAAAETPST